MVKKKKNKKSKKKIRTKKKRFYEFFKIGKKNKEKTIKKTGTTSEVIETKDQAAHQNKLLRNIVFFFGGIIVLILIFVAYSYSLNTFKHNGVEFERILQGDLIFYNTALEMYGSSGEYVGDYNVYLRKDPRNLDKDVPFEGELYLSSYLFMNSTEPFSCDGDGIIAVANFGQIIGQFGARTLNNPNATCDPEGKWMYIRLQPGNKTYINQTGPTCYDFNINNCEILEVTERFLVEAITKAKKLDSNAS